MKTIGVLVAVVLIAVVLYFLFASAKSPLRSLFKKTARPGGTAVTGQQPTGGAGASWLGGIGAALGGLPGLIKGFGSIGGGSSSSVSGSSAGDYESDSSDGTTGDDTVGSDGTASDFGSQLSDGGSADGGGGASGFGDSIAEID